MLAGPAAWLVLLEVNYVLSYVSCETRQTWFMHLTTLITIALVAAAGVRAWRAGMDDPLAPEELSPPLSDKTSLQRVRWMSAGAVAMSIWFILVIIATHIPVVVLKTCQ